MPLERKRGKLRRGQAPEGNEISAEPVFEIDGEVARRIYGPATALNRLSGLARLRDLDDESLE